MNPLILTKISKFMLIGSFSAYLSFASKNNPMIRQSLFYLLGGLIAVLVVALLWEGRDNLIGDEPTEESLNSLLSVATSQKPKRQYLLSSRTRLEVVIGLAVVIVCTLVGAI
jgi:hypothetical protein